MRPGTQVNFTQAVPRPGPPTDTGVLFIAGITSKGPSDTAVLCHNIDEVTQHFGPRIPSGETVPTSLLWDAADVAFKKGVTKMYVGRFVGEDAEPATVTLNDGAGTPAPSIAVDSNGPGPSTLEVEIVAGTVGGTIRVIVTDAGDNDKVVDLSPPLSSVSDAVQWARFSKPNLIRIRALGSLLPAVQGPTALAGGDDDSASVDDASRIAQLPSLFPKSLGPGQMAVPGATTAAMQAGLSDYCATVQNRVALLDGPDSSNDQTVQAAKDAWVAACAVPLSETYAIFSAPWRVVPGSGGSFSRVVPPSSIIAGLIASSDGRTGNPNLAAAGDNGIDDYSFGSSQPEWSDAQAESLNEGGVAVFRNVYGEQRLYGYRSGALSDDIDAASAAWQSFGASRVRMALTNELNLIGEQFLFDQLDGKGLKIAEFNGAISGKLLEYWQLGALYGNDSSDAFVVDTGPTVNTPDTIANKELHAKIGIKISPFNEYNVFDVTSVALSEVLAA